MEIYLGDSIAGVTPLPIPNREVKTCGADGTACVGAWESKSLPGVFTNKKSVQIIGWTFCVYCENGTITYTMTIYPSIKL